MTASTSPRDFDWPELRSASQNTSPRGRSVTRLPPIAQHRAMVSEESDDVYCTEETLVPGTDPGANVVHQRGAMSRLAEPRRRSAAALGHRLPPIETARSRSPQPAPHALFNAKRQQQHERQLQRILAEMAAQRDVVAHILQPMDLEARMAEHRAREKLERRRRAEALKAREEKTRRLHEMREEQRRRAEEEEREARRMRNRMWAGWEPTRFETKRKATEVRDAVREHRLAVVQCFARAAVSAIVVLARATRKRFMHQHRYPQQQQQPQAQPPPPPPPAVLSLGGLLLACSDEAKVDPHLHVAAARKAQLLVAPAHVASSSQQHLDASMDDSPRSLSGTRNPSALAAVAKAVAEAEAAVSIAATAAPPPQPLSEIEDREELILVTDISNATVSQLVASAIELALMAGVPETSRASSAATFDSDALEEIDDDEDGGVQQPV